tara:strand:- start:2715 stop:3518 length:804 start_codon:yes stop_codon:yes gene_type:complete
MESSLTKLVQVVSDLRDPIKGCAWDLEQTHKSLIPYVLEESHEVADAIRYGNDQNLIEELGDLLLQVILHAQIAKEEDRFCLEDVIQEITLKMIRRHPHVFTKKKAKDIEEINNLWDFIKASEKPLPKSESPLSDYLKIKTRSQPAMYGTMTIWKKVKKAGFNFTNKDEIWDTFFKEIEKFKITLNDKNKLDAEEKLGDVLFTLINICFLNSLNPEDSLASSNKKFLSRLSFIEKKVKGQVSNQSITYLKDLWETAKNILPKGKQSM